MGDFDIRNFIVTKKRYNENRTCRRYANLFIFQNYLFTMNYIS